MADGKIEGNDILSPSIDQRIAAVTEGLEGVNAELIKIITTGKQVGVNIKTADGLKKIGDETAKVTASQQELQKVEKQIATVQARNNEQYIKAAKALNEVKTSLKEKTVLGDRDAKTINAQNASLKQLEAALKKNKEAYKSLASEEQRMSKEGQELKAVIDAQDKAVKAQNASLGDFTDNVGNYEGALKGLKNELKLARDQMAAIAQTTGTTSPEFVEASQKAGELKDQINDLNDALKNTSASKFENVGNSLKDVGSKLANLDFEGAAQSAKQFVTIAKSITFKDIIAGLKSLGSTLASVGTAILTNPIFLIAGAITAIVLAFKYFYDQQAKNQERAIEGYKKEEAALTARYDKEIKLQQIVGKQTFELEKAKQRAIIESTDKQIEALTKRSANIQTLIDQGLTLKEATRFANEAEKLYDKEKIDRLNELRVARQAAADEIEIITAEQAQFEKETSADVAKQRAQDLFELNKFRLDVEIDAAKQVLDNDKNSYEDRKAAAGDYLKARNALARLENRNALAQEKLTAEAIILINEKLGEALIKNQEDTSAALAKLDQERIDKIRAQMKNSGAEISKDLEKTREKLDDVFEKPPKSGFLESIQAAIPKITETAIYKLNQLKEKVFGVIMDIENVFHSFGIASADLFDSLSERRISNIQGEMKVLEDQHERDLALAGDNAAAKKRIDENYEKEKARLEKKILQEKQKQAHLDKAISVFQIAIDTAKNIVKVFPNPFLMAAAGILGATQTAAVIARPIPQFFKGTKSAPGGLAMVGEQGAELMKKPGQPLELTPSVATVMDVPRGTEIIPHGETMRMLAFGALQQNGGSTAQRYDGEMLQELKQLNANIGKMKPVQQSLIRSGATVYHAIKDAEGNTKIVRGINLGRWF